MIDPIITRYAHAISETHDPYPTHSRDGLLLDDGVPSEQDYREALGLYRQVAAHDAQRYRSTYFQFAGAEGV